MKKALLVLIVGMCLSGITKAGEMATGYITLVNVPTHGGYVRIQLDQSPMVNPSNCSGSEFYIVEFGSNTEGDNRFLSMLMSAYMAKKRKIAENGGK